MGGFADSVDELAGNIDDDRKYTLELLEYLGVTDVLGSNHGIRLYKSIKKRIPTFLNLPELRYEKFMGYDRAGIKFHPHGLNWAHGWTAIHGDSVPLSNIAGQTALNAARRLGLSVVCGHTHRLGLAAHSEAHNGRLGRVLYGCEVGNMVDLASSGMAYTRGYANWQTGFAVAYVTGRKVQVIPVPMDKDGSFIFEGKVYGKRA